MNTPDFWAIECERFFSPCMFTLISTIFWGVIMLIATVYMLSSVIPSIRDNFRKLREKPDDNKK